MEAWQAQYLERRLERDEQVKRYRERLAQGEYLIVIEGTNDEIYQAETILKTQNV